MDTTNQKTAGKFTNLTAGMPLFWLSLAFIAGILVASQLHGSRTFWLGLAHSIIPPQFHLFRIIWVILAGIALLRPCFSVFSLHVSTLSLSSSRLQPWFSLLSHLLFSSWVQPVTILAFLLLILITLPGTTTGNTNL